MANTDEVFEKWLLSRRIRSKLDTPSECYDYQVFQSVGTSLTESVVTIDRFYQCYTNKNSDFLPNLEAYMEREIEIMDNDEEIAEESREFLSMCRTMCDHLEPVWCPTGNIQPAQLLLPESQKLYITSSEKKELSSKLFERFNFKNNLLVVFGNYIIVGRCATIEIHTRTTLTSRSKLFYLRPSKWNDHIDFQTMRDHLMIPDAFVSTNLMDMTINFLKILEFGGMFYLTICTDSGMVLFYDMNDVINEVEENRGFTNQVRCGPQMVLRTPVSCWSADCIEYDDVIYIALGHNGPGISIFAFRLDDSDSSVIAKTYTKEIVTGHNVPCVNFVPKQVDSDGDIVLAYASIYGNVSTLKVILDKEKDEIVASLKDTQFFSEFCWTVTPLVSSDFMEVDSFQFLNLNYKRLSKIASLCSVYQDSHVLKASSSNCYQTKSFGIGALTTQLKVPVAQLALTSKYGMSNMPVKLRFTSFVEDGDISQARLLPELVSNIPPGAPEEFLLNKISNLEGTKVDLQNASKDKVRFENPFPPMSADFIYEDIEKKLERNIDIGIFHNEPSFNPSSGYRPSLSFQKKDGRWIETNNNKFSWNRNYLTTIYRPSELKKLKRVMLSPYSKIPLLMTSRVFFSNHRGTWEEIAPYNINSIVNSANCRNIPANHRFIRPSSSLAAAQEVNQRKWATHNHAKKVRELLTCISTDSANAPTGYKLKELHSDFLLVTTAHHVYLVKTHPLLILSFTSDEIFPLDQISLCSFKGTILALNRINFVCHIKEMNCIVVASQVGLISLLRLTKYKGIYSFRQEYIFGWKTLNPDEDDDFQCIYSRLHGGQNSYCGIDDIDFVFLEIVGMDYIYSPRDDINGIPEYALLLVAHGNELAKFKIEKNS
ncbi:Protein CRT10 [Nakaseomyces bracarensis]|uniref:Protein CRT10 n=1 Tax=Nakaseomyces bracarensis TaxID=273131 RepID=A0ABR4NQB4_9SACH